MAESYYNPRANKLFGLMYGNEDDELQTRLRVATEKMRKGTGSQGEIDLIKAEIDADTTHQQQQLMKIAATAGASSGGPAVSHGGAMPYGDTAMFDPKTMPQRYLPGTKPRDEEELIPPGLFSPYRMYR